MKVSVFLPCYIDQINPELGLKMVKFLEKNGYDVIIAKNAVCCGQPLFNAGYHVDAQKMVNSFIKAHMWQEVDFIVVPSASCVGFLKNYVPELMDFKNKNYNPFFVDCINKVYEFADFVYNNINLLDLNIYFPHKVAYHSSCATLRENKSYYNTLKILESIKGLELVSFQHAETCCGFGGAFSQKFSDISISMAKHKLDIIKNTGVEYILSNDSSCMTHLKSIAHKLNYHFYFLNIVDLF